MGKVVFLVLALYISNNSIGQQWKNVLKKVTSKDSSNALGNVIKSVSPSGLSNADIASGLKEALRVGAQKGTAKLSAVDGFYNDLSVKILMPVEAKNVELKLRSLGLGKQVDNAILSMNRAAEDASREVLPIFVDAITSISINDAASILTGGDSAATNYLRGKTQTNLTAVFKPIVEKALAKTDATKYWNSIFSSYNRFSTTKVDTDLTSYVTGKALNGVFIQIAKEEQQIRKDPAARTSEILKEVFAAK